MARRLVSQGGVVSSLKRDPREPSWLGWLRPSPSLNGFGGGGEALVGRVGGWLALDGVRIGIVAGSLITGVRAGPGRNVRGCDGPREESPVPPRLRGAG